ncbi:hypothetical protein [Endozoicomonas sp. SCSIO W0465]|uniref:hypothetical protein n=1 Tax=Endozoicomonas sp. SCSIO W0465 TaxID=2918516 RepID=UPI002074FD76|nr:hypothetical protein [Endozoicomonas sp. SCSIO W0465]USE34563.1 hypothetical protein MJO57_20800 [Endozoicomonas sp. SCSIO W0465]
MQRYTRGRERKLSLCFSNKNSYFQMGESLILTGTFSGQTKLVALGYPMDEKTRKIVSMRLSPSEKTGDLFV